MKKTFQIIDEKAGIMLEIKADNLDEALIKSESIDFKKEEKRITVNK